MGQQLHTKNSTVCLKFMKGLDGNGSVDNNSEKAVEILVMRTGCTLHKPKIFCTLLLGLFDQGKHPI